MAYLVLDPEGRAEVFRLGAATSIGRDRECAIRLDDPHVSRTHCAIERTPAGPYRLTNTSTSGGTLVNGARVGSMLLRTGDRIRVASHELLYCHARPTSDESRDELPTVGEFTDETTQPPPATVSFATDESLASLERLLGHIERTAGARGLRKAEKIVGRRARRSPSSRYAQLVTQRDRLLELIEINRALTQELELGRLLEMILDNLLHLAGAEKAFLVTFDDAGGFEVTCHRTASGHPLDRPDAEVSKTILDRARREGVVVASHDAQADGKLSRAPSVSNLRLRSILCLPLAIDSLVVGALYVENRLRRNAFDADAVETVEAFADQASIAIRNARQRAAILRTNQALDALNRAIKVISSTLALGPLLEQVVARTRDATGASLVALLLLDPAGNLAFARGLDGHGREIEADEFLPHLDTIRRVLRDREGNRDAPFIVAPLIARAREHHGALVVAKPEGSDATWPGGPALVEHIAEVAAMALSNARLHRQATVDELTGLFQRGFFETRLADELRRAERYESPLSLAMIDLDHFKLVNDTYGHVQGDRALELVGRLLKANLREMDLAGRYGGEELVVVMPQTELMGAVHVAERIRAAVASQTELPFALSVSIGVAAHAAGEDPMALIESADQMLYRAKVEGRNRVCWEGSRA